MSRRSYDQYCGLARALDVLGERWTLLVVRNLLLGPQRYSDLLRGLPGITTNLLAKRLKEMEAEGLIERASGASESVAYRLTPSGQALEPALNGCSSRCAVGTGDAPRSPRSSRSAESLTIWYCVTTTPRSVEGASPVRNCACVEKPQTSPISF